MDNSLTLKFGRLANFYQSPLVVLLRAVIFVTLLFLLFDFSNSGLSLRAPLFLLSLFLMIEVFFKAKIERTPPDKISFRVARLLVSSPNNRSLLLKLLQTESVKFLLKKCDLASSDIPVLDVDLNPLLERASEIIKKENLAFVSSIDLLLAYLLESEPTTKLLFKKELKPTDLLNIAHWTRIHFWEESQKIRVRFWGQGIGEDWVSGWTLETQKYTVDFTKKALRGETDFYGREKELAALIQVLSKSQRQNAILVGEPGVGKTAIVKALALRLFLAEVPISLSRKRILELSVSSLLAGAENQGVLEERIKNIITELEHAGDVVLFIPEVQNIAGATSLKFDATGILLPLLLGDKVQVIAAATPGNYKTFIEEKTSFATAFEKIEVGEPEKDECLKILAEVAGVFERKHKINITYRAIIAAWELSKRYLPERFLPGKAISLLDEAAAQVSFQGKKELEKDNVVSLVEAKTHVILGSPGKKEKEMLLNLEKLLHQRLVNQEEAVATVSGALRRLRAGVTFENRPVGTFLFLGPTGVGKTETARVLAELYFGSEKIIRVDASEYQHQDSVGRLLDGLTEEVRKQPFSLVLLDEFEKAHLKILDLFLQVFEDGRLTDNQGRTVSFIDTIIIATSNAGAETIREKMIEGLDLQKIKPLILDELQRLGIFKPELLNRFDAIVLFEPLGEEEIKEVTRLLLSRLTKKMQEKDINLRFDERVITKVAQGGFDQTFGARPLRRFIQDNLENLLAQKILKEEIKRGDKVTFSTDDTGKITLLVTQTN